MEGGQFLVVLETMGKVLQHGFADAIAVQNELCVDTLLGMGIRAVVGVFSRNKLQTEIESTEEAGAVYI